MHTLTTAIDPEGPLINVLIGLAASDVFSLRKAGRPVPPPHALRALVDTGADVSCVDPFVLNTVIAAGIQPNRFLYTNVLAAGGVTLLPEYLVNLSLVHPSGDPHTNMVLRDQPVLEQRLGSVGYHAVLGRDVLTHCVLVYDGPSNQFILAY
jgi:hypothetical protein